MGSYEQVFWLFATVRAIKAGTAVLERGRRKQYYYYINIAAKMSRYEYNASYTTSEKNRLKVAWEHKTAMKRNTPTESIKYSLIERRVLFGVGDGWVNEPQPSIKMRAERIIITIRSQSPRANPHASLTLLLIYFFCNMLLIYFYFFAIAVQAGHDLELIMYNAI